MEKQVILVRKAKFDIPEAVQKAIDDAGMQDEVFLYQADNFKFTLLYSDSHSLTSVVKKLLGAQSLSQITNGSCNGKPIYVLGKLMDGQLQERAADATRRLF